MTNVIIVDLALAQLIIDWRDVDVSNWAIDHRRQRVASGKDLFNRSNSNVDAMIRNQEVFLTDLTAGRRVNEDLQNQVDEQRARIASCAIRSKPVCLHRLVPLRCLRGHPSRKKWEETEKNKKGMRKWKLLPCLSAVRSMSSFLTGPCMTASEIRLRISKKKSC